MKASRSKSEPGEEQKSSILRETPGYPTGTTEDLDISLLEDSLEKTPWERMQANDDALRFAESLRAAMQERNAKP